MDVFIILPTHRFAPLTVLYSMEGMRVTQLHLTSCQVLVLLILLTAACCQGTPNNSPHTTKKLLRDAIKEYKTIVEYLARLLHAAETHKPPPPTTTTTFHHSTVRRIPYPKNVHPLLPYHPSAPDASSYASPFLSTTSALSPLPSESIPLTFTTEIPKVSSKNTASSLLIPTSLSLVHPISLSSSMLSDHSTLLSFMSTSTISPGSVTEPPLITPILSKSMTLSSSVTSKLFHSSQAVISTSSSSLIRPIMHSHTYSPTPTTSPSPIRPIIHPQTHSPTLPSLARPILHSQTHSPTSSASPSLIRPTLHPKTHSPTSTTTDTLYSPIYPLLSHSPRVSASSPSPDTSSAFGDDVTKDTEDNGTRMTSKEAVPFRSNIPQSDSIDASEYKSMYLHNVSGDKEDSLGGISEARNREGKDEKEQQGKINDDERPVSNMDKQNKDWLVGNKRNDDKRVSGNRKAVNAKKVNLHMKGTHEDEILTEREEHRGEDMDNSEESNETDEDTAEDLESDKGWYKMKTQNEEERSGAEMKDEAELKYKKKRKKVLLYNHQDIEDIDSPQIKKKIKGKLKHRDISKRTSLLQKKTQMKEKDNNYRETESQQVRKNKTEPERDSMNTSPSEVSNKEHNNNHTPKTAMNYETKKHRKIQSKIKMQDSVPKIRNARHVLRILPATTTQLPPHPCTKTTPKTMQGLCVQVFSALVGVEDVMWEIAREGVTKEGIHTLQERREMLGKVVEKVEADVSFFFVVQHQAFVSYLHRLDQMVVTARQQSEASLAGRQGPSLVVLVAMGVGGGLVLLGMLVTVVLVARRCQVHREEVCCKIHTEHIPIQSFLDSGNTNSGMRKDEPDPPHSESTLCSPPGQDPDSRDCGGTQEAQRSPKGNCTFTTTFDSAAVTHTAANAYLLSTVNHAAKDQSIHSDPSLQNHKG
ncbi:uncharacterized protein LOC135115296 isoform X2 [Scylla paramamosain]|uniref:uncharacterized protein LOC135115296 isoform X2 n=1 Tax=Scylla paramamosain TaxID=85552 RepID=UPI00308275EB